MPGQKAEPADALNSAQARPLRLNSIERFHLLDDWPAWPNWIGAQLEFTGGLDESAAQSALEHVLRRHVRGHCGVDCSQRQWVWRERPADNAFTIARGGPRADWQLPPLPDPRTGRASRFAAWTDGASCCVSLQVHHALADGLGGLQFVRDWLVAYDNVASGRPVDDRLMPLDRQRLARRNELGLLRWSWWRHAWKQPVALFGATKFVFRRFVRLAPPAASAEAASGAESWPWLFSVEIPSASLLRIKASARSAEVSLNDWLTGCLFEALLEFRSAETRPAGPEWMRVIVPISLREKADAAMPAANRTTLVQLDRRAADFEPRVRLMQGIARELGIIRGWQLDRLFLLAIRGIASSHAWLGHAARWQKPRATTLLTNLGKPLLRTGLASEDGRLVVGDLRLDAMDLVAPVKHGMPVAFAAHQYRQTLRITMQADPRGISYENAEQLLKLLAARLAAG